MFRKDFGLRAPGLIAGCMVCFLFLSCEYFSDLVDPEINSRSDFRGRVMDRRTDNGLAGVKVALDDQSAMTDSEGRFSFKDVNTGSYSLILKKDKYHTDTVSVKVTLDNPQESFRLFRINPSIALYSFTAAPETTRAFDDTVKYVYSLADSTGLDITVQLTHSKSIFKQRTYTASQISDTLSYQYGATDTVTGMDTMFLKAWNTTGETLQDTIYMKISTNQRPRLTLTPPVEFWVGRPIGPRLWAEAGDPDTLDMLDSIYISWGDSAIDSTSKTIKYFVNADSLKQEFPHRYTKIGGYWVRAIIRDQHKAHAIAKCSVSVGEMPILEAAGPFVDPTIVDISQHDTIHAQVIVYNGVGHVKQIGWWLNKNDVDVLKRRDTVIEYNSTTGNINTLDGTVFKWDFPSSWTVVGLNTIGFRVIDSLYNELPPDPDSIIATTIRRNP